MKNVVISSVNHLLKYMSADSHCLIHEPAVNNILSLIIGVDKNIFSRRNLEQ